MQDARDVRRVKTDLSCYWGLTDACPRNGTMTSLSSRGCFVKTTAVTTDGQTVFVNCWLPERRWMMLRGSVIYHIDKVGFGMIFTELDKEQQSTIHSMIEHYRDNPVK
ncbi:MAG TPA: PilZ domain-containing protein [Pyrinomonadaceae bacterium]|jgi:hypothetical protein